MNISPLQAFSSLSHQQSVLQARLQQAQLAQQGAMDVRTISPKAYEIVGQQAVAATIPAQALGGQAVPLQGTQTTRTDGQPNQPGIGKDPRTQRSSRPAPSAPQKPEQQPSQNQARFNLQDQRPAPQDLRASLPPQLSIDSTAFLDIFSKTLGNSAPLIASQAAPRAASAPLTAQEIFNRQLSRAASALERNFAAADENVVDIAA